jgi:hypothetical protein
MEEAIVAERREKLPFARTLGVWRADDDGDVPYEEFPEPGSTDAYDEQLGTAPSYECDAKKRQDDHVPDMRIQELARLRALRELPRDTHNQS